MGISDQVWIGVNCPMNFTFLNADLERNGEANPMED
jgi:hypothetical protein